MKQRNPEATCGTCPYWCEDYVQCRKKSPEMLSNPEGQSEHNFAPTYKTTWCGEHPDFWKETPDA